MISPFEALLLVNYCLVKCACFVVKLEMHQGT